MHELVSSHTVTYLVETYGYAAIVVGVAVDSFGIPVPGEVMLITASVYAGATHRLMLPVVILAAAFGAIAGDNLSFQLGRQGGYRLLRRYGHVLRFDNRRQRLARYLFTRYGALIIIMGRFVPVIHIWTAFLAGTTAMRWPRFAVLNAVGCALWATALSAAGFALGNVAIQVGGTIFALSVPIAFVVTLLMVVAFRLMEDRLQREADRDRSGKDAA